MKKRSGLLLSIVAGFAVATTGCSGEKGEEIVVGSKNFTESLILGELYAQALEDEGFKVERKLNLGGTMIAHEALKSGDIDVYPEYTGTGLLAVLKLPVESDPQKVYDTVKAEYEKQFDLVWLPSSGVNNSQALVMKKEVAEQAGITNLSQLGAKAKNYNMAAIADFPEREDGLKGLQKKYGGYEFKSLKVYDNGVKYRVVENNEGDVTIAFTTDADLASGKFAILEDDKGLWPPYFVAPVIRSEKNDEKVQNILNEVSESLTTEKMQQLNAKVDLEKKEYSDVAKEFLTSEGIVK